MIGTAYLTNRLLPLVAASETGRITLLSSFRANDANDTTFQKKYLPDIGGEQLTTTTDEHYVYSKLLNSLYVQELQKRLINHSNSKYRHILVNAADPGMVNTTILDKADFSKFRVCIDDV